MAFFDLRTTGGTNIHTKFRFELQVATDTHIGDAKLEDPTGQPQVAPTIVLHQ